MALTERPADWRFVVTVPEAKDSRLRLSQGWTLDLKEPLSCGAQEFLFTSPVKVAAETQRTLEGADVLIRINGEVAAECRRCCAPLTVAIQQEFMYSYILQSEDVGKVQEEEELFCDFNRVVLPVARLGSSIDVTDLVWECLVVALPIYAACPEECVEIDSLLPAEDRRDPRFLALADFMDEEKQKGGK